jgi:hypothetical protein
MVGFGFGLSHDGVFGCVIFFVLFCILFNFIQNFEYQRKKV